MLGGRLGKYRYFDMDDTIKEAMKDADYLIQKYKYEYK
jgi:UDP-galactopyranose mutase